MKTWMSVWIAALLLPAAVLAADAVPRTWALGWVDGITLRHQISRSWDLNLAAGPNDRWQDSSTTVHDSESDVDGGISYRPSDDKREQGWVRLGAGRALTAEGPFRLAGTLSLRYLWSREQDLSQTVFEPGVDESLRLIRTNRDDWSLDLGLRASVALGERFWLETRFGLVYAWRSTDTRTTHRRLEGSDYSETVDVDNSKLKTFNDYGWYGTSTLDFVFWF